MTDQKRQLAAIMFTDIAGFTALMGQGEASAMKAVERNRTIQMPLVEKYGGQWHKDLGDGSLCSFNSSVNAVKCAIEIQNKLKQEVVFKVRIGIHLGDVTFNKGDIFGDGVNIAARIETEAAEGGICISESVYRSIKSHEDIEAVYFGKRKFRNVSEHLALYQIKSSGVTMKKRNRKIPIALLIVFPILLALLTGILSWHLKPSKNGINQVMRYSVVLPNNISWVSDIALSHDGETLVFGAEVDGYLHSQMFIRSLNSFDLNHIQEVGFIEDPVFSHDDSKVIFNSQGPINVYSMMTGNITKFGSASSIRTQGITWIDDAVVFAPGIGNNELVYNLIKIPSTGRDSEILASPQNEKGEVVDYSAPFYIDGSNKLLYQANLSSGPSMIRILDLTSLKSKDLLTGQSPKYINTGHLLFKEGESLMGVTFDVENSKVQGTPNRLLSGVDGDLFSISSNGIMAFVETQELKRKAVFVDRSGVEAPIALPNLESWDSPRISPDNSKIVFVNPSTSSLWIYDIRKETSQLLVSNRSYTAVWLPDGENVAYRGNDSRTIFMVNIMNPGKIDTLVTSNNTIYPVSFSSNGNLMFYDEIHSSDSKNILIYDREKNVTIPFLITPAWENMARFSPNDKLVAYSSNETGQFEIYLKRFPDTGEKWNVSIGGGTEPMWSKDGDELFYRNGNRIMAVQVKYEEDFDYGKPDLLIEGAYPKSPFDITNFDISQNGDTFLMLKPVSTGKKEIHIIVNWFEELKELMGGV